MPLASTDTYIQNQIETKLSQILSNRYIIEEILKDMRPEVVKNFIETYHDNKDNEINVVFAFPQEKLDLRAVILVQLKEGEENKTSIGNMEGTYYDVEDNEVEERSTVALEEDGRMSITLSKPIGDYWKVEEVDFSVEDDVKVEGNKLTFEYNDFMRDMSVTVHYSPLETNQNGKPLKEKGTNQGFTAEEIYSVVPLSNNMDTVRCLDLLVRAIFIMMRSNKEEHRYYQNQQLSFGQIELQTDENSPELLFGREIAVKYTTSYSLRSPDLSYLEEIIMTERLKTNG